MAILLSHSEYWSLFKKLEPSSQEANALTAYETIWTYPKTLGQGEFRIFQLREGLELSIGNYQLYQDVVLEMPPREHPLEYELNVAYQQPNQAGFSSEHYFFSGSGLASEAVCEESAGWHTLDVSFHIEPELFRTWMGDRLEQAPPCIQHLVKAMHQDRCTHSAPATLAMQTTVQQILQCPYTGLTQQIYLESKVWELMALHIEQMLNENLSDRPQDTLKPDDIERIHYARKILQQQLSDPPLLNSLARQVGLNEFTLKRGFRKVFGTTVFGCLHHYRMEHARELLEDGRLNVSEVAQKVGFTNRGHFAAAFRKRFGANPKTYAQAIKRQVG